jgi:hypothetical protein
MKVITLANLADATEQEVFDHVAKHLLTQKKKSKTPRTAHHSSGSYCSYRNPEGLTCAAGCLMADGEYSSGMEGRSWGDLLKVPEYNIPKAHEKLIGLLQDIHDFEREEDWLVALRCTARALELVMPHGY